MKNVCQFCEFYQKLDENIGECRRKPPVVHFQEKLFSIQEITTFPRVPRNSWCGEHKEKK